MAENWTPGPWSAHPARDGWEVVAGDRPVYGNAITGWGAVTTSEANARLIAAAPTHDAALNYVADMTYCGADAEWHFKKGYDPQIVLDALAKARGEP